MAMNNLIQSPLTLEQICIDALQNSARYYLKLRNIINFPVTHLAQRLLKVKSKKSLIIIALKKTFADGCYIRAIACGFNLATRQFVLGHFEGVASKNIGSRIMWTKSINVKDAINNLSRPHRALDPIHNNYNIMDTKRRKCKETRFLLYYIGKWIAKYRAQLNLKKSDISKINKLKKMMS